MTLYTLQAGGLAAPSAAAGGLGLEERVYQLPNLRAMFTANLQNSLNLLATETGGRAIFTSPSSCASRCPSWASSSRRTRPIAGACASS